MSESEREVTVKEAWTFYRGQARPQPVSLGPHMLMPNFLLYSERKDYEVQSEFFFNQILGPIIISFFFFFGYRIIFILNSKT